MSDARAEQELDALSLDDLATEAEALREASATYQRRAARVKARLGEVEAELRERLVAGSGEVAVARTGRVAFVEVAPMGRATVDEEALRRHADSLADLNLAPREETVTRYPSVTALRDAARALRARGFDVREFLEEAPEGPVLRWRKAAGR